MQTGAGVDSGSSALTWRQAERLLMNYKDLAGSGAPDRMIEAFTSESFALAISLKCVARLNSNAFLSRELSARTIA